MYFAKTIHLRCINAVFDRSYHISQLPFSINIKSLQIFKKMSNDSIKRQLSLSECDDFFVVDKHSSSKLNDLDCYKKYKKYKSKSTSLTEVKTKVSSLSHRSSSGIDSATKRNKDKVRSSRKEGKGAKDSNFETSRKYFPGREDTHTKYKNFKISRKKSPKNIDMDTKYKKFEISSEKSPKSGDGDTKCRNFEISREKSPKRGDGDTKCRNFEISREKSPKRGDRDTKYRNFEISRKKSRKRKDRDAKYRNFETSREKSPKKEDQDAKDRNFENSRKKNSTSFHHRKESPIVIDLGDDDEDNEIIIDKLDLRQSFIGSSNFKFDVKPDELHEFLVLDTLPSPSLIDIDHPNNYKMRKHNYLANLESLSLKRKLLDIEKEKNKAKTSGDNISRSVIVIDIDDMPDADENTTGDSNKLHACQQGSSKTKEASQLSSKCKNAACNSSTMDRYYKLDEPDKTAINNNNNNDDDDDDVIYESTVGRNYLSLIVEKESDFFRKHLRESSSTYQKRKYCTSKTFDDRKKISKGSKYKKTKDSSDSSSSDQENLKILTSEDESFAELDISDSVLAKIREIRNTSDCSATDGDNSDIVPNAITLETSDVKPNLSSEIDLHLINLPPPKIIDTKELIEENSDDSIQSTGSFFLGETLDNYEGSCMDLETDESEDDDIVIGTECTDFIPLNSFKLSDLEICPPISDDIKTKRLKLEGMRNWELTGLGDAMVNFSQNENGTLFTLLSYNVLSQQLLWDNKFLYAKCNPDYLEWSYRWPLFQHEVRHLQPDIITLQEVESSHYNTHYLPWFKYLGYNCIFKKKTREKVDGCAIIYNTKKFDLIEENSVEYYQPRGERVLDRDNVGLIVKLTPTSYNFPFCVATTHILFNPRRIDVKLAQMTVFLAELDRICYITEEKGQPTYCPVILTGDFNSEPFTPLLKLIRRGSLQYAGMRKIKNSNKFFGTELIPPSLGLSDYCQHKILDNGRYLAKLRGELFSLKDKRKIEEQLIKLYHSDRNDDTNEAKNDCPSTSGGNMGSGSSGALNHAFNFRSVYYHYQNRPNLVPEVTTCQDYWTTVDYIFYTRIKKESKFMEGPLKLIGRYGLLGAKEAKQLGPIPSDICPSDHFPLAAQFLLRHKN